MIDENLEKKKKGFFHSDLSRTDGTLKNYFGILFGYIDTMVLYNLFFILTSLGIVTLGPSFVALNECFNDLIEGKSEHRYRKYFEKIRKNFNLANVLFGLIIISVLAGMVYLILFFWINIKNMKWMVVPFVLAVIFCALVGVFSAYYSLMKVRMSLDTSTILKNAFLLTFGDAKACLKGVLCFVSMFLLPLFFLEYCFPLFIAIEFTLVILSLMMSLYSTVDRYVIYDYEKMEKEKEEVLPHIRVDLADDLIRKDK